MRFELEVGQPEPGAFAVYEFEELGELRQALRELASAPAVVSLIAAAGVPPPFSIPEAFVGIVEAFQTKAGVVRCIFSSERAKALAARGLPRDQRPRETFDIGSVTIEVTIGDVAKENADAIVNASNTRLELGGGVSGAIRAAASDGAALQRAMLALAPIEAGGIAVTSSWLVAAPTLLHVATASGEEADVPRALENVLRVCNERRLATVAIPALGCGTGGLAMERFVECLKAACRSHVGDHALTVKLMLNDAESFARAVNALATERQ